MVGEKGVVVLRREGVGSQLGGRKVAQVAQPVLGLTLCSGGPPDTLGEYSSAQRVTAVSNPPSPAILARAEPEIATGPAMASPDDRTNTGRFSGADEIMELRGLVAPRID